MARTAAATPVSLATALLEGCAETNDRVGDGYATASRHLDRADRQRQASALPREPSSGLVSRRARSSAYCQPSLCTDTRAEVQTQRDQSARALVPARPPSWQSDHAVDGGARDHFVANSITRRAVGRSRERSRELGGRRHEIRRVERKGSCAQSRLHHVRSRE
jgi:hypothetical protein